MAHLMKGNGRFDFDIVGESHWQPILGIFAGPKVPEGCEVECLCALVYQDDNPHDDQAVVVMLVRKNGSALPVGYLSRANARRYRKSVAELGGPDSTGMLCRALIVGGWSDTGAGEGQFGIKLDFVLPVEYRTAKAWDTWQARLL